MVQRPDASTVRALAGQTAAHGFLSIYVDAASGRGAGLRDAAIEIKNRLGELERNVAEQGPEPRSRALAEAIASLGPALERLTDPSEDGIGRALFAPLDGGDPVRFASRMPLPNRVVLDDTPFIHPLLELLDEGRPTGVVLAAQEGIRVLEWRLGELEQLAGVQSEASEAPHERSGPIGTAAQQSSTPRREQAKARGRDRLQHLLREAAGRVGELAGERDWDRLLVSGGERLTDPLAAELGGLRLPLVTDSRNLAHLGRVELDATVSERLGADHRDREARLLTELADAAHTGSGALGLSDVLGALNDGRVRHLVYDPEVRYVGTITAEGRLYPHGERAPGEAEKTPETRLTERLVERALATDARVSPVEGAAGVLEEANGIGAILRW